MIEIIVSVLMVCATCIIIKVIGCRCKHEWKIQDTIPVQDSDGGKDAYLYVLRCSKCGEIKQFEVKHKSTY